ncbi:putative NADH:ubiquinone/plastoquinone oxidoreductase, chain 3 [Helianthus anomalus]
MISVSVGANNRNEPCTSLGMFVFSMHRTNTLLVVNNRSYSMFHIIRYYMFALVFVVFEVETVFLYLWAMSFDVLGVSVFVEALIFVLILIVGLVYAWRKGALEWS